MTKMPIGLCKEWNWNKHPSGRYVIEPKLDGVRGLSLTTDSIVLSRLNNEFYNTEELVSELERVFGPGWVVDGELLAGDRALTVGLLHTKDGSDRHPRLKYYIFDLLTSDEYRDKKTPPLLERRTRMHHAMRGRSDVIIPVGWSFITGEDAVRKALLDYERAGYEGAVLKHPTAPYPFKRSDVWLKLKGKKTGEFICSSIKEGAGKHAGRLGSIEVQSFDGEVTAWVGGGFDDAERDYYWAQQDAILGHIVEIEYRKVTDLNSLESPQFVAVRTDLEEDDQ
jgi:DNA ligase 1